MVVEQQEEQEQQYALCLNMIVKNESHIIKDTLIKLLQKIEFDYWVISDTGSTDRTKEIITEYFKEVGIPGELYEDEWVDFAHNRNKALKHAFGKSKYLLVFDADDEICGDFVLPELTKDSYGLQFGSYTRTQIVNNYKRWKYVGVLHEHICPDDLTIDDASAEIIKGSYHVISGRTGNRNLDSNKYLKDATVLEKAYYGAFDAKDNIYIRYGFYCANSYYDCEKYESAISWYKKTLENGGWAQEKYVSCLRLYNCYNNLGNKEAGFFYLVKSAEYDRERAECYYELIKYYTGSGLHDVAYGYYGVLRDFYNKSYLKTGLNNKLFIDVNVSDFFLPYYVIIISDRMRDYETGIQMYRIIFTKKCKIFDEWYIGNLLYNLQFFIEHVKDGDKTAFYLLFQEYIDFLLANNFPICKHYGLMNKYKKYGIVASKWQVINEECSTSTKILIYTGFSNYLWNDSSVSNIGIGGSHKAVAYLARNFPKEYEIIISGDVEDEVVGNVTYVNRFKLQALLDVEKFHTIIVSRYVSFFLLFPYFKCYQLYLASQDTCFLNYCGNNDISANSLIEENNRYITGVICLTPWHKLSIIKEHPCLKDKINVINNGILVPLNKNTNKEHNFGVTVPSDNIVKKKWYCFIHSCHFENKGLSRLDYLITSLKSNDLFSKFETIYINNIGLPIEEDRYGPTVDICNYSDNPALYEIPTINKIQHFSQTNADCNILYLHTKGIRYNNDVIDQKINDWIDMMLFFLVKKYELCISKLDSGIQAVGCNYNLHTTIYTYDAPRHFSGNFWWTNSNYTKTLPLLIEKTENVVPNDAEYWLCQNNPTICDLHNSTNINHYYESYPSTMYADCPAISLSHSKIKNKFVWTSCSDRGLDVLLKLWDKILEVLPDATLDISSYLPFPNPQGSNVDFEIASIINRHSDSIKHHGILNTEELYDLMSKAEYWLYTCTFCETSCITALEMMMNEVVCLYYPLAGLNDTIGKYGIKVNYGDEIQSIMNLSEERKVEMRIIGKKYAMSCSWENRAKEWASVLGLGFTEVKKNISNLFDATKIENIFLRNKTINYIKTDSCIGFVLKAGCYWEEWMFKYIQENYLENTNMIDLGGNIGTTTLLMSEVLSDNCNVFTFEPVYHDILFKNISDNNLNNKVVIYPYGVGNEIKSLKIKPVNLSDNINFGGLDLMVNLENDCDSVKINIVPLDYFNFENVSLIKIDVENMEIEVLEGCINLIKRCKPTIIIESHQLNTLKQTSIFKELVNIGYEMSRIPEGDNDFIMKIKI
jgi:FkbM family methyltransferase